MNKAVSWSVKGVGFGAREVAEEAARRQRMSLGEWLNTIIAERAAEAGVGVEDIGTEERREAIVARLHRLSEPDSTERDNRRQAKQRTEKPGRNRGPVRPRQSYDESPDEDLDASVYDEPQRRTRQPTYREPSYRGDSRDTHRQAAPGDSEHNPQQDLDLVFEEALESFERRVARTQKQTGDALATVAGLLESSENQQVAFAALVNRLQKIEGRAAKPVAEDGLGPIKGALARLEARLESLARRTPDSLAETPKSALTRANAAPELDAQFRQLESKLDTLPRRQSDTSPETAQSKSGADPAAGDHAEQMRRLEAKLNSVLEAVQPRAGRASLLGSTAATPAGGLSQRLLGEAIGEISRRQHSLEEPSQPATGWTSKFRPASDRRPAFATRPPSTAAAFESAALTNLQRDVAGLAVKLDEVRREIVGRTSQIQNLDTHSSDFDQLRDEIAGMSSALANLAPRGSVIALEAAIRNLTARIETSREAGVREGQLEPLEQLVRELRQSLAEIDPRGTITNLEHEIRTIGGKLESLAVPGLDPIAFQRVQDQTQEIRDLLSAASTRPMPLERIEQEVAALAQRLEHQTIPRSPRETGGGGVDAEAIRSLLDESVRSPALQKIEARLEELAGKVNQAIDQASGSQHYAELSQRIDTVHQQLAARIGAGSSSNAADTRSLESMVSALAATIEAAQQPQASNQAIEALERQIGKLAERLDRSDSGFAALNSLQHSVGELFAHLEETRHATVEAADAAARNAVREVTGNLPQLRDEPAVTREIADLRATQDDADRRTHSTLNAVHETLEKVVDRLAMLEHELADVRLGGSSELLTSGPPPVFAPAAQRHDEHVVDRRAASPGRRAPDLRAGPALRDHDRATDAADFLIEPGAGFPGKSSNPKSAGPAPQAPSLDGRADPEAPTGRSDFIAAARRAAQAAQMDSAATSAQRSRAAETPGEGRTAVVDQARAYFANRKKTIVLSVAALFVVAGAYAVIRTMNRPGSDQLSLNASEGPAKASSRIPDAPKPDAIERKAPAAIQAQPDTSPLTPQSALPTPSPSLSASSMGKEAGLSRPIAGSDPIVVGTIAAKPTAPDLVRPMLAANLREQADAGNPAAQFEMATRYAEGRLLPRDFKLAVQWYEKAALQGLAPAQYRLGSLYEKGLGATRDVGRAKSWYIRAADQGNARAMHNLAVLTAEGADGKPDYTGAATWFRKAAELGIRDSQYNLAILYARGLGVTQDLTQSYAWFAIAAAQGDEDAGKKRDDVAARLDAKNLAAAKAIADGFRPHSLDQAANEVAAPTSGWDAGLPQTVAKPVKPKVSSL